MILKNNSSFNGITPMDISGCAFYVNFNDITNGSYVVDQVNGIVGSIIGSPAPNFQDGRIGSCFGFYGGSGFDGTAPIVLFGSPDPINFLTGDVTISLWTKPYDHTPNHSDTGNVFNTHLYSYWIRYDIPSTGSLKCNIHISGTGTGTGDLNRGFKIRPNEWNHVVISREAAGSASYWANGILRDKYARSGIVEEFSSHSMQIGAHTGYPQFQNIAYSGLIDEIAIYPRVLSDIEINQLYEGGYYKFSTLKKDDNNFILNNNSEFIKINPSNISGCIAYWNLDETSGNAIDSVGGFDAITTTATQGIDGRVNKAYSFDGTNHVRVLDNDGLDFVDNFSVSFWMNPSNQQNKIVIAKSENAALATDNKGWQFKIYNQRIQFENCKGPQYAYNIAFYDLPEFDRWYYVVGVHDALNSNMKIFVDGKLRQTSNLVTPQINSTYDFYIGRSSVGGNYTGLIDEVSIFNKTLTSSEIQQLYQNGYPKFKTLKETNKEITLKNQSEFIELTPDNISGCVAYFNFDTSGTVFYDSNNVYSGTSIGSVDYSGGRYGNCPMLEGSTSYLNLDGLKPYVAANLGSWTVSSWIWYAGSSYSVSGGRSTIIGGRRGDNIAITIGTDKSIEARTDDSAISTSANVIEGSKWTNVVCAYQLNDGSPYYPYWEIYVDGDLIKNGSYNHKTANPVAQGQLYLGYESRSELAFNGRIDELSIYNRNLSPVEVNQIYKRGYTKYRDIKEVN